MADDTLQTIAEEEKALAARKRLILLPALKRVRALFDPAAVAKLMEGLSTEQANIPMDNNASSDVRSLLNALSNVKANLDREIGRLENQDIV